MCSRVVAAREQRRVQPRVQRLHPPVEDLGRAGELGDVGDLDPRLADRRGGAAGGEDLDAELASARARSRPPRSCRRPRSAPVAPAAGSRRAAAPPSSVIAASRLIGLSLPRARRSAGSIVTSRGLASSSRTRPAAISADRLAAAARARSRGSPRSSSSRSRLARYRHRALEDDRARVDALVDEVDRDPGDPDPVVERLADRVEARERGQQRRVDVDHPVRRTGATKPAREQLHVAGEHDQVDLAARRASRRSRASRASRSGMLGGGEGGGLDPGRARPLERRAPGLSEPTATTSIPSRPWSWSRIACRLVPVARGEHRRPATRSRRLRDPQLREAPAGRAQPAAVDQRVDLAQQLVGAPVVRTRRSRAARRSRT